MTWVEPKSFPNALPTNTTAGTFSWNGLPSWGRMMVTPVHSESPAIRVVWPTVADRDVRDGVECARRQLVQDEAEVACTWPLAVDDGSRSS